MSIFLVDILIRDQAPTEDEILQRPDGGLADGIDETLVNEAVDGVNDYGGSDAKVWFGYIDTRSLSDSGPIQTSEQLLTILLIGNPREFGPSPRVIEPVADDVSTTVVEGPLDIDDMSQSNYGLRRRGGERF